MYWPELGVMLGAVLLALVLNFDDLFIHLSTHLPGSTPDDAAFALWHVWWASFGLSQSDGLVIHAWTGAPFLSNHLTYLPILQGFFHRLLTSLTNPILAFNLLLLFSQIATHLAVFYFLLARSRSPLLAALASTAFIMSPWYADALTRADIIALGLWPLPLALLAWDNWLAEPRPMRAALLVIVLEAAILSGLLHLAWIVAVFLPYVLWTGLPQRQRLIADDSARDQLSIMLVAFLILFFVYPGSPAVRSLLDLEPPFGPARPESPPELTSFIGPIRESGALIWLAALVTLPFVRTFRRYSLWLSMAFLLFLFGVHLIPEPARMFSAAFALPYQRAYPDAVFLGLTLFALLAFLADRWGDTVPTISGWRLWAGTGLFLTLLILADPAASHTLPVHALDPAPVYADIAAEPEDYLVLVYPFGLHSLADGRESGTGADLAQYAVWYEKRTLSGLSPYLEPAFFDRFADVPFLRIDEATPDPDQIEALTDAVNTWRIGYVLVYSDHLSADEAARIAGLLDETDALCPPFEQGSLIIYRARWHPEDCP